MPGYLKEFEIVIDWKFLYWIPNWCPREEDYSKTLYVSGNVFEYDYLEAKAFTSYKVYMRAKTAEKWSNNSDPQIFLSSSGGIFYFLSLYCIII